METNRIKRTKTLVQKSIASILAYTMFFSSAITLEGCTKRTNSKEEETIEETLNKKNTYKASELSFIEVNNAITTKTYIGALSSAYIDKDADSIKAMIAGISDLDDYEFTESKMAVVMYNFITHEHEIYTNLSIEATIKKDNNSQKLYAIIHIIESKENNTITFNITMSKNDLKTGEYENIEQYNIKYSLDKKELLGTQEEPYFNVSVTPFTDVYLIDENDEFDMQGIKEIEKSLNEMNNKGKINSL